MALLHSELRGSLISELLAFEELSYVALSYWALIELSPMALLHSKLCGSLIFELLAFEN